MRPICKRFASAANAAATDAAAAMQWMQKKRSSRSALRGHAAVRKSSMELHHAAAASAAFATAVFATAVFATAVFATAPVAVAAADVTRRRCRVPLIKCIFAAVHARARKGIAHEGYSGRLG